MMMSGWKVTVKESHNFLRNCVGNISIVNTTNRSTSFAPVRLKIGQKFTFVRFEGMWTVKFSCTTTRPTNRNNCFRLLIWFPSYHGIILYTEWNLWPMINFRWQMMFLLNNCAYVLFWYHFCDLMMIVYTLHFAILNMINFLDCWCFLIIILKIYNGKLWCYCGVACKQCKFKKFSIWFYFSLNFNYYYYYYKVLLKFIQQFYML